METLTIQSIGFSAVEKQLLIKQLEILNPRMEYIWRYEGEGTQGEMVLAKYLPDLQDLTSLVVVSTKPIRGYRCIESPIRLTQLEQELKRMGKLRRSNAMRIKQALRKSPNDTLMLEGDFGSMHFDQTRKHIYTGASTIHETVDKLAALRELALVDAPLPSSLHYSYSYTAVLWLLAKRESEYACARWPESSNFKIATWPRAPWNLESDTFKRMSLLFSRAYLPLEEAAKASSTDIDQVRTFLHCCDASGTKILTSEEKIQPKRKYISTHQKSSEKLLSWLKKKIWSTVKHAS